MAKAMDVRGKDRQEAEGGQKSFAENGIEISFEG